MNKLIILLVVLSVSIPSLAQYKKRTMSFPGSKETDLLEGNFRDSVCTSMIRVLYDSVSMPDTLARDNFDRSVYALQISRNGVSLFEDYDFLQLDSAFASRTVLGKITVKDFLGAWYSVPGDRSTSPQFWKNYPEKQKQTFFNLTAMAKWTYTQDNPDFGWKIETDSVKTILEYPCLMATGKYAGRNWKVWFTLEIPISDGPWKLCGLPGLILMAEDDRKEYSFTAFSLKNVEYPLYLSYEKPFVTTRERYLKIVNDYMSNGRNQIIATGLVTGPNLQQSFANSRPYNPIEQY